MTDNKIESRVTPSGTLTCTLLDAEGNIKSRNTYHNTIVSTGCALIASLLVADKAYPIPSHMAIGTDSTTPSTGDTSLKGELDGARVKFDSMVREANNITYAATFEPGVGTGVLREAGIFNNEDPTSTDSTMLNRVVFPIITKEASDTLIIQWVVSIT